MLLFLKKYFSKSIDLKKRFEITETKSWTDLCVLNELYVQLGHVYSVLTSNSLNEEYRNINNLGDEISDVFFQLMLLLYYSKYDIKKVKYLDTKEENIEALVIALGQCSEAILEKNGLRFNKERPGFISLNDYILYKINEMFSILYNYCNANKVNIDFEYNLMLVDANNFLDRYKN